MIEYSLYKVLEDRGIYPDYVLGSSLGEFAAAAVSGVSDAEDMLDCILEQAIIIQNSCDKGKMLAILDKPQLLNDHPQLFGNSELISINYDSHFVISGEEDHIRKIMEDLKEKQILCQLLPVSYAFHSSLIDPAESAYAEFLRSKSFQKPSIPIVSSLTGSCLHVMDGISFGMRSESQ